MNEEIWELQDALNKLWQYEDTLQDTDRDAWRAFQLITDQLQEAVESAESQLGWAVQEAREYAWRVESLEDEVQEKEDLILELRESREDMIDSMKKWMEDF